MKDSYQTLTHPNVYAVGIAAAVNAPGAHSERGRRPQTGFPSETMAHVAATNIASQIREEEPTRAGISAKFSCQCASWTREACLRTLQPVDGAERLLAASVRRYASSSEDEEPWLTR